MLSKGALHVTATVRSTEGINPVSAPAFKLLCREAIIEDAWEFCLRHERPDLERQLRLRSAYVYATDVACQVATIAFRYGGGSAIYNDRVLQRCMRDINAAAQHFMVNTSAYDNLGQFRTSSAWGWQM